MIKTLLKFEPRDEKVSIKNIITLDVALFNINATLPFYIYKGFNQTGSSLFKQNYEYVKENFEELSKHGPLHLSETWFERSELVREEKLLCRRLDDILKEKNISSNFHFIKIDAQGAEFEILQGGENTLKNCIGLHLELFSVPLYQGIKLLPDVEQFLSSAGFTLVKKFPAHGTFDSQNDCVFLKLNTTLTRELKLIKNIYGIK
ncbi:MAG: FkbM family methyltransferase [Bacteroidetes bacterium]|nr:FkbM family methyltransferase [Bacteroidota bacterium]